MADRHKVVGKILAAREMNEMQQIAERYGILVDSKIDLRSSRCRFNHSGLDLREFLLESSDLSGSTLTDCNAEGVSFDRCTLKHVSIIAGKGKKASFRSASFREALLDDVTLGPRTLDLSATDFRKAKLTNVTFMMGKLHDSDFSEAWLADVLFRSAELNDARFCGTSLTRVSFEKATLAGADFSDARFNHMEQWGEPDFSGARISDDLKYRFGIVREPLRRIAALSSNGSFSAEEVVVLRRFLERNRTFLSNREIMLIGSEYSDEIDPQLFIKMMKALKDEAVH